jgi:hypothetical protein
VDGAKVLTRPYGSLRPRFRVPTPIVTCHRALRRD